MAGNRIVHRCNERGRKSCVAVVKSCGSWEIYIYGPDMNDYHDTFGEYDVQAWAHIKYCPFCGEKLNVEV